MKRFQAAVLISILLMGMIPVLSVPARMLTTVILDNNVKSAYVGQEIYWYVWFHNAQGVITLFTIDVYRSPGELVQEGNTTDEGFQSYIPTQPGSYYAHVMARDFIYIKEAEDYSGLVTVSLRPAPRNLKTEALSAASARVSWDKVNGAAGYEVWRSTSKTGTYTRVKTLTGNSFTNTGLKAGQLYFYKVRAYNMIEGTLYPSGNFSAPKGIVPLAKPTGISTAGISASQIKLTWKKVTGATGYQVLMAATPGGVYKAVKSTTALSTAIGGLKSGKTYYFKVRAYKTISSVRYYGPLSVYKGGRTK